MATLRKINRSFNGSQDFITVFRSTFLAMKHFQMNVKLQKMHDFNALSHIT